MAARPRTLPAAVAPVLVGTALAIHDDEFAALAFIAALLGAMLIQIGTNLSNDYSDARRGADTEDRLGPVRVTAGGLVPPRPVSIRSEERRVGEECRYWRDWSSDVCSSDLSSAPRWRSTTTSSPRWRSSPPCSGRCSSRSGRTCPTTTPTRGAAPTPRTGSGPCG